MQKENVSIAVSGRVVWVPASVTTEITGATDLEALTGAVELGYVSEDGVEISDETSRSWLKAWQNNRNVRQIVEEITVNVTATLIENTKNVREMYFRNTETGGKIEWKPGASKNGRLVIDYLDPEWGSANEGEELMGRFVFVDASVSETESITLTSQDAIGYGITWAANPDANGKVADIFNVVLEAEPEV